MPGGFFDVCLLVANGCQPKSAFSASSKEHAALQRLAQEERKIFFQDQVDKNYLLVKVNSLADPWVKHKISSTCKNHYVVIEEKNSKENGLYFVDNKGAISTKIETTSEYKNWLEVGVPPVYFCHSKSSTDSYQRFRLAEDQLKTLVTVHVPAEGAFFRYREIIKSRLGLNKINSSQVLQKLIKTIPSIKEAALFSAEKQRGPGEIKFLSPLVSSQWLLKLKQAAAEISQQDHVRHHVYGLSPEQILQNKDFYDLVASVVKEHQESRKIFLTEESKEEEMSGVWSIWSTAFIRNNKIILKNATFPEKEINILNKLEFEKLFSELDQSTESYIRAKVFIEACLKRAGETDRWDCLSGQRTKINKIKVYLKVISNIYAKKAPTEGLTAEEKAILWQVNCFNRKSKSAMALQTFFNKTTVVLSEQAIRKSLFPVEYTRS